MRYLLYVIMIISGPASASGIRIDGQWCSEKGGRVDISGQRISIQGKPAFDGLPARHEFAYTVPVGEAGAGGTVVMRLRDAESMTSFTVKDSQTTDPVDWKRCQAVS